MKSTLKRLLAGCLCLVLCAGLLPVSALAVDAASTVAQKHYGGYASLATIANQGDCYGMQGMTMDSSYTYCAKINGSDTPAPSSATVNLPVPKP